MVSVLFALFVVALASCRASPLLGGDGGLPVVGNLLGGGGKDDCGNNGGGGGLPGVGGLLPGGGKGGKGGGLVPDALGDVLGGKNNKDGGLVPNVLGNLLGDKNQGGDGCNGGKDGKDGGLVPDALGDVLGGKNNKDGGLVPNVLGNVLGNKNNGGHGGKGGKDGGLVPDALGDLLGGRNNKDGGLVPNILGNVLGDKNKGDDDCNGGKGGKDGGLVPDALGDVLGGKNNKDGGLVPNLVDNLLGDKNNGGKGGKGGKGGGLVPDALGDLLGGKDNKDGGLVPNLVNNLLGGKDNGGKGGKGGKGGHGGGGGGDGDWQDFDYCVAPLEAVNKRCGLGLDLGGLISDVLGVVKNTVHGVLKLVDNLLDGLLGGGGKKGGGGHNKKHIPCPSDLNKALNFVRLGLWVSDKGFQKTIGIKQYKRFYLSQIYIYACSRALENSNIDTSSYTWLKQEKNFNVQVYVRELYSLQKKVKKSGLSELLEGVLKLLDIVSDCDDDIYGEDIGDIISVAWNLIFGYSKSCGYKEYQKGYTVVTTTYTKVLTKYSWGSINQQYLTSGNYCNACIKN